MKKQLWTGLIIGVFCTSCNCTKKTAHPENNNLARAQITLESLYAHYGVERSPLLRETYPFNDQYTASYLGNEEQAARPNAYSYLWPFSGTLSATGILLESTQSEKYRTMLETRVLPGLEEYFDTKRNPYAYASYIHSAPPSDRFYDDNIWIGIDLVDLFLATSEQRYLDKAKQIWIFIESGTDDQLGGGIYWCEQRKKGKNTCSNAPGSVYALKLFEATRDSAYFYQGKNLYEWTKKHLQDPADYLYYDNISLNGGRTGKTKYAYNSGQMLQSAALLYQLTQDEKYLEEAQHIAASCYNRFFKDFQTLDGEIFKLIEKGNVWFTAIMFRGFIELYSIDKNKEYIRAFQKNLDYAWKYMREDNGLFNTDWSGKTKDDSKWLLTQAAMVEMYARSSVY